MYQSITTRGRRGKSQASIVTVFRNPALARQDKPWDQASGGALSAALKRAEVKGELGEVHAVYAADGSRYVVLGLGEAAKFNGTKLRAAAGSLVKALDRMGVERAQISLNTDVLTALRKSNKADAVAAGRALGEGLGLGAFRFDDFKKSNRNDRANRRTLTITATDDAVTRGLQRGLDDAESTNFARRLAATPPNVATTTYIAQQAQKLARSVSNLKCTVIKGEALERQGLVGLMNVGKASENPPCLIQFEYKPRGRADGTVLVIGKTLCYDTGGLSLKPRESMKGMKYDKNGGMAVLGALHAIARIKPSCRVVALLPTAENSVSDEAYRPDDIIEYPNGVSVEVTNTDAEGRLVLADALVYGTKKFKPDAVIDLATLTGGIVIALGDFYAGLFCNDEDLRARVEAAATMGDDPVWPMPLTDDYRDMMKAKHADIWNSAPVRSAHPVQGAAFLSYFIDEKIPWAHLDIAGSASTDKPRPPFDAGPTGSGVRLLINFLEHWSR